MKIFELLFTLDMLEEPGAREIPVIVGGGQRDPQNLGYFFVGHPNEIPQFHQFGLNGILVSECLQGFMHGQEFIVWAWRSELQFIKLYAIEAPSVPRSLFAPSTIY